ncbi:P-loop containing nucleoside triphosphate hydrolase protein [Gorgonomyces haynaldii]|nr:P-loop containing nucleoside triphosphate hydrolase protein [Gorgonomyces haynaldii]
MGSKVGQQVGYKIRFEQQTSQSTRLTYMTDGMLLRELLTDPQLKKYSVIILDEAHERSLRTDILFGSIKKIMKERPKLKIVIMSATLNADRFVQYFGAGLVQVPGRQFPVKIMYAPKQLQDHLDASLTTIMQIHKKDERGDILCFLTGQEEIENLQQMLEEQSKELKGDKLLVCPLFASLPTNQQTQVFEKTPDHHRKVGIKFVVDCGLAKQRSFQSKTGVETLKIETISKQQANQRSGRAGREQAGECYRLYTEKHFQEMEEETVPEIKRVNLDAVLLLLKASGIENVAGFDFMDKPSRQALIGALEHLFALGALDQKGQLTPLGKKMAGFPVSPSFARKMGCSQEIVQIVAMLSVDSIFYSTFDQRQEQQEAIKRFASYDGDPLTLLNVFKEAKPTHDWCKEHFVMLRSLKIVRDIHQQLVDFMKSQSIPLESKNDPETLVKCLLYGFFKNIATRQQDGTYKTLSSKQVYVHPASVLFQERAPCVMFIEWVETSKSYLRQCCRVQPSWLSDVAPHYFKNSLRISQS